METKNNQHWLSSLPLERALGTRLAWASLSHISLSALQIIYSEIPVVDKREAFFPSCVKERGRAV